MDLRSDRPYMLLRNGLINVFPSVQRSLKTDVTIIGAGITGSLIGWHLAQQGIETTIIDRRHAGMGSTAASTSLLQYEIDVPLQKLIKLVGEKNAVLSYLLCRQSIYDLQEVCKKLPGETGFELRPSFQFASTQRDISKLKKEYELRKSIGINLQYLDVDDILQLYGFKKPAGLLSADGGTMNAYQFTHALLKACQEKGVQIYDNTMADDISYEKDKVVVRTEWGHTIESKKLIIACGYESQQYVPKKVTDFSSTYAIISEPIPAEELWHRNSMIWETAMPYTYIRTTDDHRILVGGKDDDFVDPVKRDASIYKKSGQLHKIFLDLFPHIPFRKDFSWAGTFSGTKDGLPYIGSIPERKNTWFALGFGGNGITFSMIAAQILTDLLTGKPNAYADIFSFNR